jgi:hypothetical protein
MICLNCPHHSPITVACCPPPTPKPHKNRHPPVDGPVRQVLRQQLTQQARHVCHAVVGCPHAHVTITHNEHAVNITQHRRHVAHKNNVLRGWQVGDSRGEQMRREGTHAQGGDKGVCQGACAVRWGKQGERQGVCATGGKTGSTAMRVWCESRVAASGCCGCHCLWYCCCCCCQGILGPVINEPQAHFGDHCCCGCYSCCCC